MVLPRALRRVVESATRGPSISVGQFNLLASHLAISKHFPYTHPHLLHWSHRRETLLREMRDLQADILCCQVAKLPICFFHDVSQEVTHFHDFFQVSG